jgi:hypothetical protein
LKQKSISTQGDKNDACNFAGAKTGIFASVGLFGNVLVDRPKRSGCRLGAQASTDPEEQRAPKFTLAYENARRQFFTDIAVMSGGSILIADASADLSTITKTETITPPPRH